METILCLLQRRGTCFAAHAHGRGNRQRLEHADEDEQQGRMVAIHQRAKEQGPDGQAAVEARIHDAIHAPGGILRRRRAYHQVARRPRHARRQADGAHQHHRAPGRHDGHGQQHGQQRGGGKGDRHVAVRLLAARAHHAAGQHAHGRGQHIGRVGAGGQRQAHAVQLDQGHAGEALDAAQGDGGNEEEGKAHPYGRQAQEIQRAFAAGRLARRRLLDRLGTDGVAIQEQDQQHAERQHGRALQRDPPVIMGGNVRHEQRCQGPADVAADAMHGKTVGHAGRRDALVEYGVVGRMEHAVAHAGQHGAQHQRRIAVRGGQGQRRHAQQKDTAKQHGARAEAVDDKAGQRLSHARDDEEHRHQQAQFRIGQVEGRFQPDEQGREYQMVEVRHAMRQPHQGDDARIAAQGWRSVGKCRVSCYHVIPCLILVKLKCMQNTIVCFPTERHNLSN